MKSSNIELYIRDWYATIIPSVKRLRRFEKISLEPGESNTAKFRSNKKDHSFVNSSVKTALEPGRFDVMVDNEKKEYLWK